MKTIYTRISVFSIALALLVSSCGTMNNTQKGAGIGAAAGAILGGVLGNNIGSKDNAALGAVLGAAVGGVTGGVIGKKMDKQAVQISEQLPGATVQRVGEGIRVILGENAVKFDLNKSTLTAQAKTNLDNLVPVFQEYADTNIQINGYTDSTGAADYNLKLSEARAKSVADYLKAKGISADRLTTKGFGIADPIADNTTEQGRAENRRVEFAITANEKMIEEAGEQAQ
ncbi:MAG: OmpA family protein [Flavobacteriales bacterium]|nr:OmpA family protein [Flavobacteriales bacterium]